MTNGIPAYTINTKGLRDLAPEALDPDGRLRVLPSSFWEQTTRDERAVFGVRHGLYSFPTVELVERLHEIIGERNAIEIGAGHGVLSEALGIVATDSYQQTNPTYQAFYEAMNQPIVPYGPNVQKLEAKAAVRLYRPQVVIGCWVTHKYDPNRHAAGGNEIGIDEEDVLRNCAAYIIVGNERVHDSKKIWKLPHTIEYPSFVFSRSSNGSRDFLAKWPGGAESRRKPKKVE